MENNQLVVSLTKAMHTLNSITNDDLQRLSLIECARIVYALPSAPEIAGIRGRLASRLQRQLSVSWIEQGNVCEVFSVLTALWQYQPVCVTGEHLAATLQRLIAAEHAVGGPYNFKRTDTVRANAKVAIFMRLVAKPLPNVDAFLAQTIADGQFSNTRLSQNNLIYLLAQANATPKLIPYVKSRWMRKSWQTPLRIATALTVLDGRALSSQVQQALAVLYSQQRNGLWEDNTLTNSASQGTRPLSQPTFARKISVFSSEKAEKGGGDPIGSSITFEDFAAEKTDVLAGGGLGKRSTTLVTTAIVIGVLTRHQPRAKTTTLRFRKRQQVIMEAARQALASHTEPLRSSAIDIVAHVGSADKNFEITQLAILFADALKTPSALTDQQYTKLGLASLFGWIAYTIYDDFMDGAGQPEKLPVANIAMRASVEYFRAALPRHTSFAHYASKAFSVMDEANAWEIEHCRFIVHGEEVTIGKLPKYGQRGILAKRSFAHTLAPMAVLWQARTGSTHHIKAAFTHYLVARQLSDDLHDWVDDMKTGQASYVVTTILRDIRVKPGVHKLSDLFPTMQKSFRRTVLPKICEYILQHAALSRQEFQKSGLLHTDNNLYALLDRLEMVARYSLDMRAKSLTFYEASKSKDKTLRPHP